MNVPSDIETTARQVWVDALDEAPHGLGQMVIARALLKERKLATRLERKRCAEIAETYKRDASFDDSMVGAGEHCPRYPRCPTPPLEERIPNGKSVI